MINYNIIGKYLWTNRGYHIKIRKWDIRGKSIGECDTLLCIRVALKEY